MKKMIIILGVLGVSMSAIFVRYSNAPSLVLVFYRTLFAALILFPIILKNNRLEISQLGHRALILPVISGAFLGIHFTAYFQAVKWTSIASAVVLTDTEVFFVAIAMFLVLSDKIPLKGWVGIIITFFGSVIIGFADAGGGKNILLGDGLAISAAFFMSIYTIIGSICRKKMSTMVYTFIVYLSASLTVLLIILIRKIPLYGYGANNYLMALMMAVFCTILGHSIFSWGLKYEKASFVSIVKLLEPVFATLLGMLLFTEIPNQVTLLGAALVIAGILVYSIFAADKKAIPKNLENPDSDI